LPALDLRGDFLGEQTHALFHLLVRDAPVGEDTVDFKIANKFSPPAQLRRQHLGRAPQIRREEFLDGRLVAYGVKHLGCLGIVLICFAGVGKMGACHFVMFHQIPIVADDVAAGDLLSLVPVRVTGDKVYNAERRRVLAVVVLAVLGTIRFELRGHVLPRCL